MDDKLSRMIRHDEVTYKSCVLKYGLSILVGSSIHAEKCQG